MPFGNDSPFPLTDAMTGRWAARGWMTDFMKSRNSRSRSFETFDFNVKALDTTNQWTVGATSTATTWAVLAAAGGWLRGVTGASVATGALQLSIPTKYWNGTSGAGFASLIKVSDQTEVRIEQGFADVLPAVGTTAVNLASASMNSVTTGAVYMYDHTGSTTTTALYTIGSSTAVANVATTTNRYASGVTLFVALEIYGRSVKLWVGDVASPTVNVATATTAADTWLPFVAAKTSSGSKNIDIDTLWVWTVDRA